MIIWRDCLAKYVCCFMFLWWHIPTKILPSCKLGFPGSKIYYSTVRTSTCNRGCDFYFYHYHYWLTKKAITLDANTVKCILWWKPQARAVFTSINSKSCVCRIWFQLSQNGHHWGFVLLLAKISKKFASMFVWRFVCVFVCLSVCPSITHERFDISSPNLTHICILGRYRSV